MKESMGNAGNIQGDMNPKVEDFQRPASNYSQEDFNKTTQYVERQDAYVAKECASIKKQAYQGRYS